MDPFHVLLSVLYDVKNFFLFNIRSYQYYQKVASQTQEQQFFLKKQKKIVSPIPTPTITTLLAFLNL